ncbi:thiamine pyrophosphate-binding protein [Paracoccus sp. SY]|uniref:thiamine pyrophosphate-binding protein n=1 Tax=Paracoccus sp. SY TaxID=1330255 RepID=UPI000CD24400|nr:thiamine pyrophosphate-binding protein [Paracoccus sp. SY]
MKPCSEVPVHRAIAHALGLHGIRTMFGLIGDANLFMVDSFVRHEGGRFLAANHEGSAVLMAHGHAQAQGRIGVATITHGTGLTNAVTALVEAVRSSTSMVVLCGDTPKDNLEHLQQLDQPPVITATGAGLVLMRGPRFVYQDMARAFYRAMIERRPIVLNMPVDLQWQEAQDQPVVLRVPDERAFIPASDDLDEAVGIIAAAHRPLVLAGRGAASAKARDALIRLAARIGAPLSTTLRASGLFAGDPFNLGVCGTVATDVATETILESDCVIAFGAGLNYFTAAHGSLMQSKRIVQVDISAAAIGARTRPTIGIVGDAARTADRIAALMDEAELPGSGWRSPDMARRIADCRLAPRLPGYPEESLNGTIDLREALLRLERAVSRERNVAVDLGRFVAEALRCFPAPDPRGLIHSISFGSIGLGLPTAIGAAVDSQRPTVLISGDGGFMMGGLTELHTARRCGVNLVIIICSDGSYGAEHVQFTNRNMDPAISLFDWPDFQQVAESMGVPGHTVRNRADLEIAAQAVEANTGVVLIDLKLDPDRVPWN